MPTKTWVFGSKALADGSLRLLRMESFDALSRLYEIVVDVQATHDDVVLETKLAALLSEPAYVATGYATQDRRWGVLRSIELVTVAGHARPIYRAVLVPRLWYATQTHRSRVFLDLTVPEIVASVFNGMGLLVHDDYRVPGSTYPKREYVVQYEETDYAFVSRLLEDEGITLHFDHGAEREVIVLSDSNSGMRRPESLRHVKYRDSAVFEEEAVFGVTYKRKMVPRDVVLVDYDWRKPAVGLLEVARVHKEGRGLYFSGAQHFRDKANGVRLAKIRAEELRVEREVYRGKSTIVDLRAGDVFTLEVPVTWGAASQSPAPPRPELDGDYLVLEVQKRLDQRFDQAGAHAGSEQGDEFVAIRVDVTYRPPRTTPKPRIDGVLYATIDSPDLDIPAPIDAEGRYKVVLPFDLAAQAGGRASRWIRMAQPLSGAGYGVHFPLHEGAEVVLAHVQGDPDRPVIVGAVPNAQTPSPVTSRNATQSIVRTSTGIFMEFEDDA
jgi:type VI secretion system secreted protein VgrG